MVVLEFSEKLEIDHYIAQRSGDKYTPQNAAKADQALSIRSGIDLRNLGKLTYEGYIRMPSS